MLVQMNQKITGYRDGEEWPEVGGVIDVPSAEATSLIANGYAKEASDGAPTEDGDTAEAGDASGDAAEDGDDAPADGPEDAGTIEGAEVVKPKSPPRKRTSRKADA